MPRVPVNLVLLACFIVYIVFHQRAEKLIPKYSSYVTLPYFKNGGRPTEGHFAPYPQESVTPSSVPTPTIFQDYAPAVSSVIPPTLSPAPATFTQAAQKSLEEETVERLREAGVVVVFKTGAQEEAKAAIHLGTTLRHFQESDVLFFSDQPGTLGAFPITDALQFIDQDIRKNHPDFKVYRDMQDFAATGRDIGALQEHERGDFRAGWRLDKYKFMHMSEQAFIARPLAKWFVFMETDTYVVWPNLLKWLKTLDSTKPLYAGAPTQVDGQIFAHGGTGYVVSYAAMRKVFGSGYRGEASAWDGRMNDDCCGDLVFSRAMSAHGIDVTWAVPFFNGRQPVTVPLGPNGWWCHPVVTMHHVSPKQINGLWTYERRREKMLSKPSDAMTFSELYAHFVEPEIKPSRDDWDNTPGGERDDPAEYTEADATKVKEKEKKAVEKSAKEKEDAELKTKRDLENGRDEGNDGNLADYGLDMAEQPSSSFHHRLVTDPDSGHFDFVNEAWKSGDTCKAACEAEPECFQFLWRKGNCALQRTISLGRYRAPDEDGGVWKSGWLEARIGAWTAANQCVEDEENMWR